MSEEREPAPDEREPEAPVSTGGDSRDDDADRQDERVDEASEESFPASDPPAF